MKAGKQIFHLEYVILKKIVLRKMQLMNTFRTDNYMSREVENTWIIYEGCASLISLKCVLTSENSDISVTHSYIWH